ncbi:NUDIX hydrolase [bacterium]|nr:NUDIX hydrolase [bacterium]
MKKKYYSSPIITLYEENLKTTNNKSKNVVTLDAPDWVNIIPITALNEVVFVEQLRYGTEKVTLEIPGGMVDSGETNQMAAERELIEETGFQVENVIELGSLSPNPALFTNKVTSYVGHSAKKNKDFYFNDKNIKVHLIPIKDVNLLINNGKIDHALVVAAFSLFRNRE